MNIDYGSFLDILSLITRKPLRFFLILLILCESRHVDTTPSRGGADFTLALKGGRIDHFCLFCPNFASFHKFSNAKIAPQGGGAVAPLAPPLIYVPVWKSVEIWSTIIIEMCFPSDCLFSPDFVVDIREKEFGVPWLNHQEEVVIAKLLFETEWCMSESRSPRKPYAVVGMLNFLRVQ